MISSISDRRIRDFDLRSCNDVASLVSFDGLEHRAAMNNAMKVEPSSRKRIVGEYLDGMNEQTNSNKWG